MKSHWPSQVKPEWQVEISDYPAILPQVLKDFTADKTKGRNLIRIAGLSGSGKTTQLLPATEAFFKNRELKPVLVAAREFVKYHPHHNEIKEFYGEENLRKMTDEFSTIMLFLAITELIKNGYDIILDVTLLDPAMEHILKLKPNSSAPLKNPSSIMPKITQTLTLFSGAFTINHQSLTARLKTVSIFSKIIRIAPNSRKKTTTNVAKLRSII